MRTKKLIADKAEYQAQGFNTTQATSLAWAEHFNDWMHSVHHLNNGEGYAVRIDTYCRDCKCGGQFLPSTCREFIVQHKGHQTKTIKLR